VALGNSVLKRREENTNVTKTTKKRSDRTIQWSSDQQRLVIIMQTAVMKCQEKEA
jgi:uncharacterized protein YpmS